MLFKVSKTKSIRNNQCCYTPSKCHHLLSKQTTLKCSHTEDTPGLWSVQRVTLHQFLELNKAMLRGCSRVVDNPSLASGSLHNSTSSQHLLSERFPLSSSSHLPIPLTVIKLVVSDGLVICEPEGTRRIRDPSNLLTIGLYHRNWRKHPHAGAVHVELVTAPVPSASLESVTVTLVQLLPSSSNQFVKVRFGVGKGVDGHQLVVRDANHTTTERV